MGTQRSSNIATAAHGPDIAKRHLRAPEKVRAIFTALTKYIHAKTIYTSNNPNLVKIADAFYGTFRAFFEDEPELRLGIEKSRIKWHEEVVYENDQKTESLAFLLYKDGVGEIAFQSQTTKEELDQFVDIIRKELYNPSAHLDVVSRLWNSQFTNISYLVFDEYGDGASGESQPSGRESSEQQVQIHDHQGLPDENGGGMTSSARSDATLEPLGRYVAAIAERKNPQADPQEKEQHVQRALTSLFGVSSSELDSWRRDFTATNQEDKLSWLLRIMFDFTQSQLTPAESRTILEIMERLLRFSVEDPQVPTLIALLDIQKQMVDNRAIAGDFRSLTRRIREDLTNREFLVSLGTLANRAPDEGREVLRYFRHVGRSAVPGVCALLAHSNDPTLNEEACGALAAISGSDISRVVHELNLENPHEAKAALYILERAPAPEAFPTLKKLACSPDSGVREHVAESLAQIGNDEAAQLLTALLEDKEAAVRLKALDAAEKFKSPQVADKLIALCFSASRTNTRTEELDRMFRALGLLAGEKGLAPLKHFIQKKAFLSLNKTRERQNKLLAITALKHIPGMESLNTLKELARDGDNLVRTKAHCVLKQLQESKDD